jgi:sulfur relay (sulfurtransferase) DsrF/TusC family protein
MHAMHDAGAELAVLLRGNAVNYVVRGQNASGLAFGERRQTNPPRLDADLTKLLQKGVAVFVVEEDAAERGILPAEMIEDIELVARRATARLLDRYTRVWHW